MIINIRVDHKIADIETMENMGNDLQKLFNQFKEEFNIREYIEINTCNRKEYYFHTDSCSYEYKLLNSRHGNLIIEYGDKAVIHLFRMTSGLESMIIGEDQILGQIKQAKKTSIKESHCGKVLDILFTKAVHVGQVVRQKTKINRGSVSIGSAAVDLAEKNLDDLQGKQVLVIGAGKMGKLVAKALAEKELKAIFVANRTYYRAVQLAEELNGKAIFLDNLSQYLPTADVIISATGAPHIILNKERIENSISTKKIKTSVIIDIANPRDIDEDVKELGFKLFNIDDLRGIADENKKLRENEVKEAEKIIDLEFNLLEQSFKLMEIEGLMKDIRIFMEGIRETETQKAIMKLVDVEGSTKILDNMSKAIVNKIFHNISLNIKKAIEEEDYELIEAIKCIFKDK
ncbi:glutamyl-tRNA reductase [Methanobrevibacter cuticularis]|uniref:Glutamyl-tRNA reductase n=1 Tax=Methanobrevibacter cuticularis TaxID=47311 RepID=A0A166DEN7_9EURY|nr:glutamyl-tRNA reductase [Methanobrevibacter cuticularis]KZX15512.1 glutamyl-tRNA reductase [Methanobrevibacter cuticularis]